MSISSQQWSSIGQNQAVNINIGGPLADCFHVELSAIAGAAHNVDTRGLLNIYDIPGWASESASWG